MTDKGIDDMMYNAEVAQRVDFKEQRMLLRARDLALKAHEGQVDKSGAPYIGHCIAVSNGGQTHDEQVVGYLHDVVEDTTITLLDMAALFPDRIVTAVDFLTRRPRERYTEYIRRVKCSPLATAVKINDLKHNLLPSRSAAIPVSLTKWYNTVLAELQPSTGKEKLSETT